MFEMFSVHHKALSIKHMSIIELARVVESIDDHHHTSVISEGGRVWGFLFFFGERQTDRGMPTDTHTGASAFAMLCECVVFLAGPCPLPYLSLSSHVSRALDQQRPPEAHRSRSTLPLISIQQRRTRR